MSKLPKRLPTKGIRLGWDLIRERTKAGRDAAKSRGVFFGRPRKLNPEQAKLAQLLVEEGKAVREVAETFNVHVATIYRVSAAGA